MAPVLHDKGAEARTVTMKLMRAVVPAMLAQGSGSIVNTASEAALRGSAAWRMRSSARTMNQACATATAIRP